MKKLFNKSFFRFLLGFVAIIAASFVIVSAIGYYQASVEGETTASLKEGN